MSICFPTRHTRRELIRNICNIDLSKSVLIDELKTNISSPDKENIIDFSPSDDRNISSSIEIFSLIANKLLEFCENTDYSESNQFVSSKNEHLDFSVPQVTEDQNYLNGKNVDLETCKNFKFRRQRKYVDVLPDGQRIETFNNGSILYKDALGRVIEISSMYGDSLFMNYNQRGELHSFYRINRDGQLHSTACRERQGVVVRDSENRICAIGESMSVDPWGCFYLHTSDGQYFCLDLVAGIHSERRRLYLNEKIDFLTAAFAHDGFRMATLYTGRTSDSGNNKQNSCYSLYRFYGRDGTVIEFSSEDDLKYMRPARALPPGSLPVSANWRFRSQAYTAWESIKEYKSMTG